MKNSNCFKNFIVFLVFICLAGCSRTGDSDRPSFIQIGEFTVNRIAPDLTEVKDGAGRTLVLVPHGAEIPDGVSPHQVVRVPVKRVVAYGFFDVATLRALGVLKEVLVGVTYPMERWYVEDVKKGMADGKIAFLGDAAAVDFERLRQQQPDLVLTWDASIIPMMEALNIPCAVTSTPTAMCLNARMRYVQFLAPFLDKQKEADAFFDRCEQNPAGHSRKNKRRRATLQGDVGRYL